MIHRIPSASFQPVRNCPFAFFRSAISAVTIVLPREMMFANRMMEIPLPMPLSLMRSAIHIMIAAPAQKQAIITTYAK